MAFKSDAGQCSCGNICNRLEKRGVFDSNVNKIFLGTDDAASSWVGQILPLRVEGSIPYSAPLMKYQIKSIITSVICHFSLM